MLDKIKDLKTHVATKATDAVEGMTTSVKGGIESLANTATTVTDNLNETAVRASTAQMCTILEIALDELRGRPLSNWPASLTATVNIGIASLQMQIDCAAAADESGRTGQEPA